MVTWELTDETNGAPLIRSWLTKKEVFWFDVSVDDSVLVHVLKDGHQLNHQLGGRLNGEGVSALGVHSGQTWAQQLHDESIPVVDGRN